MKKRVIKRKPSGKKPYFTKETQANIKLFIESEDFDEREKIYREKIKPALETLVENLIFVYGFHKQHADIQALKHNCVINLFESLHKFDHDRNKNAFSYFNVVAKNWLIIYSRKVNKIKRKTVYLADQASFSAGDMLTLSEYHKAGPAMLPIEKEEKQQALMDMLGYLKTQCKSDNENRCMDAIIKIFRDNSNLDYLNKRAIFVYVRELSGLNSKQLSVCMSNIRKYYRKVVGPDKEFDIL